MTHLFFLALFCVTLFEDQRSYAFRSSRILGKTINVGVRLGRSTLFSSEKTMTEKIFERVIEGDSSTGAGGASSFQALLGLNRAWEQLKDEGWKKPIPPIVFPYEEDLWEDSSSTSLDYDVVVVGGTLGVFYAYTLQSKGYRVAIIERGQVKGRSQEWNISKKELQTLVRLNILSESEVKEITSIEFNPVRVGFHTDTSSYHHSPDSPTPIKGNGFEMNVTDILNLGIKPDRLIEMVKNKFLAREGKIFENTQLQNISLYDNLALINYASASKTYCTIKTRLVVDAMGNGSPIVRQIRGNVEPDGICIVVGSCARGFEASNNTYSDVIYTNNPITTKDRDSKLQYFWEAFPAGSGETDRTTYLFTYLDAKRQRPSILSIFEDYWTLLPRYQGKSVDDLQFLRVLFGFFPTYRASPVQTPFSRIIQVGDASGIQSPLSFGGFGSLTRHLERITQALHEALQLDLLSAEALNWINFYQPNLSACWMFQRAMSVKVGYEPSSDKEITSTLSNSFAAMKSLGEATYRPFLQDVLQFVPLLKTLSVAFIKDPLTPIRIIPHVGLVAMLDFFKHFFLLGVHTLIAKALGDVVREITDDPSAGPKGKYYLRRLYEAVKFGSGLDYYDHE